MPKMMLPNIQRLPAAIRVIVALCVVAVLHRTSSSQQRYGGGGYGVEAFSLSMSASSSASASATAAASKDAKIVVITHAAGRMGKLLALQIHEDPDLIQDGYTKVRAVCRSDEEAIAICCDLGGIVLRDGQPHAIPCDWLETVVISDQALEDVDDEDDVTHRLNAVFADATAAVLCDASHNELEWQDGGSKDSNGTQDFRVRVPSSEIVKNSELSSRLLKEIAAAATSNTLQRIIVRSSMGCGLEKSHEDQNDDTLYDMMGGDVALTGPKLAELQTTKLFAQPNDFEQNDTMNPGQSCVILRLGALTDDAGMVPLMFDGTGKDVLLQQRNGRNSNSDTTTTSVSASSSATTTTPMLHPPILSRADAARVSVALVKAPWFGPQFAIVECAWMHKYGRNSVGTEETVQHAQRQNLQAEILTAVREREHDTGNTEAKGTASASSTTATTSTQS